MSRSLVTLIGLLYLSVSLYGQSKFEREYRIGEEEIPSEALEFVSEISTKIKWFGEENERGKSIEAKFKFKDSAISVEFDTLGNMEDIEVGISKTDIAKNLLAKINSELSTKFDSYTIKKIQKQYSGTNLNLMQAINSSSDTIDALIRYELVVKGKVNNQIKLHEVTFEDDGTLIQSLVIILDPTDHLDY